MKNKDYLQSVVDYIEDHIYDQLSVDILADYIGFSKYYLHRLFSIYSGMSLMEYVRKRKLNFAMYDLKSRQRIVDIALNYNYSSERAFSRAFVQEFNHSPSYYRTNSIVTSPKLMIRDLTLTLSEGDEKHLVTEQFNLDEVYFKNRGGVLKMLEFLSKVRYETLEEMLVISATVISSDPEDTVIHLLNELIKEMKVQALRSFGFDSPVSQEQSSKGERGYEFYIAFDKNDLSTVDAFGLKQNPDYQEHRFFEYKRSPIYIKTIPSYRYASLRITDPFENPFERIPVGWKALVKWIEDNNLNVPNGEDFKQLDCLEEVIDVDGITCMDIYIPIDRG